MLIGLFFAFCQISLTSSWKEVKKLIKDDPRYSKFSSSDRVGIIYTMWKVFLFLLTKCSKCSCLNISCAHIHLYVLDLFINSTTWLFFYNIENILFFFRNVKKNSMSTCTKSLSMQKQSSGSFWKKQRRSHTSMKTFFKKKKKNFM